MTLNFRLYRVSQNAADKLGGEVESHNYIKKARAKIDRWR